MSRRTMIVLVLAATLVLANGGIALGKGPESVTIAGPGIDTPIELMEAVSRPIPCAESCPPDPMVRLMEQSGIWYAAGDLPIPADRPDGELGPRHVLTWIRLGASDETVDERTIRQFIYLYAENGPLVHTPSQIGLEGWGPGVVGWFTAPRSLPDTLDALGVPLGEADHTGSANSVFANGLDVLGVIGLVLVLTLLWANRRRPDTVGTKRA